MERIVWVQDWQIQCCGDPFTLGQRVSWTLSGELDRDYLASVLGEEAAARITDYADHHETRATTLIEGTVLSIDAVWCRFAPRGWDILSLYPVPGTTLIKPRTSGDGWEEERRSLSFVGYVVTLTDVEEMKAPG